MMRRSASETAIPERSSETHRGPSPHRPSSPPNSMRRSASASGALIDEEQFEELTAVFDHSAVGNLATSVVSFVKDHVRHPAVAPAARSPSPTTHANHHQPTRPVSHIDLGHYHPGARHYAWLKWASSHSDWRLHLQLFLDDPSRSLAARAFSLAITAAILAQALLMMVETGSWGAVPDDCATWVAGWVLTAFFSVELVLVTISKRNVSEMFSSPYWWVDLISVVPDWTVLVIDAASGSSINGCGSDAASANNPVQVAGDMLEVFRVVRILKIARYNPDSTVLFKALSLSARALAVPVVFVLIGAFFFGAILYYVEHIELVILRADRSGGSPFGDIGEAIWCMLVTFTTVGYGDVSPEGHAGKVVGSVAILAGVVLLAMPLAIVGNNFSKAWEERSKVQLILRVQRTCIDRNISLNGMLQLFEEADTDRSGFLDYLEFHRLLDELGLDYTASEARRLFHLLDEGQSGDITFFEFCHAVFPNLDVERLCDRGILQLEHSSAAASASAASAASAPPSAASPAAAPAAPGAQLVPEARAAMAASGSIGT